jgi:hypothetical protein
LTAHGPLTGGSWAGSRCHCWRRGGWGAGLAVRDCNKLGPVNGRGRGRKQGWCR